MSSEVKRYLVTLRFPAPGIKVFPPDAKAYTIEQREVVLASDYAALEAENARLAEDVKKWQALAQNVETLERITESAEARRAQLAAIQGGMGEADPDGRHDKIKAMHDVMAAVPSSSLYSLAEALHDAGYGITAAMAAEVQTWKQLHADAQELYADAMIAIGKELGIDVSDEPRCKHVSAQAMAMAAEVERLMERYECSTAIMRAQDEALSRVNKERDALRAELAEVKGREAVPVAYGDPKAFKNLRIDGHKGAPYNREWMWAATGPGLVPLYTTPPASPDAVAATARAWELAEHLVKVLDLFDPNSRANVQTLVEAQAALLGGKP